MAKEANPWAGVNVVGWKYSYFLKILAAKLAAERGVFLQFDEVAVGVAHPGLFGIVVASLAASDGYAALFKKRHVVVQSLDLQAEMVEAGQPGVAGVFEGFKGLGRFAAAVGIGVVEDLDEGHFAEGEVVADGRAIFA